MYIGTFHAKAVVVDKTGGEPLFETTCPSCSLMALSRESMMGPYHCEGCGVEFTVMFEYWTEKPDETT